MGFGVARVLHFFKGSPRDKREKESKLNIKEESNKEKNKNNPKKKSNKKTQQKKIPPRFFLSLNVTVDSHGSNHKDQSIYTILYII